jgi:hypothetical protein
VPLDIEVISPAAVAARRVPVVGDLRLPDVPHALLSRSRTE